MDVLEMWKAMADGKDFKQLQFPVNDFMNGDTFEKNLQGPLVILARAVVIFPQTLSKDQSW